MQPLFIDPTRLGDDDDFSFMVGVFSPKVQVHVLAFSEFVRLADYIADSAGLTRQDKLNRLEILDAALGDEPVAAWSEEASRVIHNMRHSLSETHVSSRHIQRIVHAFLCDVRGEEKRTWQDLLAYCDNAAAPVGRYMLELLHEDPSICGKPADDLCASLRILSRLREPAGQFNRLCIPTQFMNDAMISIDHLKASSAKGQTRAVIDRVLDGVDRLLRNAEPLPGLIRQRGLRMHTAVVLCRAQTLAARFREEDPLQEKVTLSQWQRFRCHWTARIRGLLAGG
jgi:phytoene/squalene synthetase